MWPTAIEEVVKYPTLSYLVEIIIRENLKIEQKVGVVEGVSIDGKA